MIRLFKKLHRWPSVIIAFFAMMFATSGIIMNHRETFSSVEVSRKLLPHNYRYKNWNLAAVRGSLNLNSDTSLLYGNIGIWSTTDDFGTFSDFNQGFPDGVDNRKIYSVVKFSDNVLVAGTHFGLYTRRTDEESWKKLHLNGEEDRIADLAMKDDTLIILSRHFLFKTADLVRIEKHQLPVYEGYVRKTGLFNTLWELHSGELWGITGKLIVDLLGIVVIVLSITGLLHFLFPGIIRRWKAKAKPVSQIQAFNKKNMRWHNVIGYVFVPFLIINTTAGMFLRPPLLIPIANSRMGIIPGTHLDTPNPWFDKLRRISWDVNLNKYIISTTEGFFLSDESLSEPLGLLRFQPPVSLMGCNIFENAGDGTFIVGSFNGIFSWNTGSQMVTDYFTGKPVTRQEGTGKPVSENMAAGMVKTSGKGDFWFDYNRGAEPMAGPENAGTAGTRFPAMPRFILENAPMSLWNVAQEFHTGRIFEHLTGPFYILYVPLAGLCLLTVLVSGFFMWWLVYRKKRISNRKPSE